MLSTRPNLTRPHLTLDEQSFQGLLAAAFTIQEHNDRCKLARPAAAQPAQDETEARPETEAERVCPHCGALRPAGAAHCPSCGPDELRPGELLQHNWASMWLMSQERGLWPERSAGNQEAPPRNLPAAENRWTTEAIIQEAAPEDLTREDGELTGEPLLISADDEFPPDDASIEASAAIDTLRQRFTDWRVKLRFRRADLYLGTAIFVAALALLWPTAGSLRRASLSPWERMLVTLGIAEAPAPVIHLQRGDPGVEVWVDPHSAVYYCPGEEQFGKTAGGRLSRQGDAQMDRFEPASRSACE